MLIIIGAGLTGLSCGFKLKNKKNFLIFEKENTFGGLCRTLKKDGFLFDFSGHLLHLRWDETKNFVLGLLKENVLKINRDSKIYTFNRLIDYPFQINLHNLPQRIKSSCIKDFIYSRIKNDPINLNNFKDWSYKTFGKSISEYFMIPYNEKLHSFPSYKLTAKWIEGFVPLPTISDVIKGAYIKSIKNIGYNHQFYYPKFGGIQSLTEEIYNRIKNNVILNNSVISISFKNKTIRLKDGNTLNYSKLISTIPLKELILNSDAPHQIKEAALRLKHNTLYILNLGIKKSDIQTHWIYFPQKNIPFYRLGFYTNFSPYMSVNGFSSLYLEFSFKKEETPDLNDLENKTIKILKRLKIIKERNDIITSMWVKIDYPYVIYDKYRESALIKIFDFLKRNDVISIGRYGSWKYSFMEENIKDGFEAAKTLIVTKEA